MTAEPDGRAGPVVGSVREEAEALAAAVSGWLANAGLPGLSAPCALLAEHLSGAHLLRSASCPACLLNEAEGPSSAAWGHLGNAARSLRAAAASTRPRS